jgi:hypothetical protein
MGMGRQISDQPAWRGRIKQYRMRGADDLDFLEIAIGPGMIVRPQNVRRLAVVDDAVRLIGINVRAVEVMRAADAAERADRASKIHVIPRDQQAAAVRPEPADRGAILRMKAVAGIDCEEPKLVEARSIDFEPRKGTSRRSPTRIASLLPHHR